jgi:hypothetical protein
MIQGREKMSAIEVNEAGLMKRPTQYDECVKRRAAELALPEVKGWNLDIGSDEDVIKFLMKHINRLGGYEIVKSMESDGWDNADSELVEIMDEDFIGTAERELVKQWVKCLGVKLEIPIGTQVRIKKPRKATEGTGEVVNHYPEEAKYGVRTPDLDKMSNWILLPEDIEVVE